MYSGACSPRFAYDDVFTFLWIKASTLERRFDWFQRGKASVVWCADSINSDLHSVISHLDYLVRQDLLTTDFDNRRLPCVPFNYSIYLSCADCRAEREQALVQHERYLQAQAQRIEIERLASLKQLPLPDPPEPKLLPATTSKLPLVSTPARGKNAGYVYLLKSPTGCWKIGHARDPQDRMRTFHVKLPFEVEFEHLIPARDCIAAERELHKRFADKRVNGEWFKLDDKDVAAIKKIKKM